MAISNELWVDEMIWESLSSMECLMTLVEFW